MKRAYLAGPMSGLPNFNYDAFNAAAAMLRDKGFHVQNPAENPQPACGSWAGYMRMAIRQMTMCDAVVLLPGWENSHGATLEVRVAGAIGMAVYPIAYFEGRCNG